ncbi:MAG TPA: universal stress protein [Vicinamibacterales bacterium]|nr:universal stress protein [Vicinamibacterales bacterium]
MALSQRRHYEPARELFGKALAVGRSERETRALLEQASPLVDPAGARVRLWPPPPGTGSESTDAVLSSIRDREHDLVMKALARSPRRRGALIDPLDSLLIRQCPCPVWLADPTERRRIRRIVAAVNPVVNDRLDDAIAVASVAAAVAASSGAELHVLHAWIAYGETLLRPRVPPHELQEYVDGEREAAAERVDAVLAAARIRIPAARIHLVKGHFHRLLPGLIERNRIDLVVMGTRGRQGWTAGALLRPYAEVVLRDTCGPLLVVKSHTSCVAGGRH